MDSDLLFTVLNNSVLPAWLLLVFAPRWRGTYLFVHSAVIPVLLGAAYGILLFSADGPEDASFFSLDGVMAIFSNREVVIAAWVHYLIFDLFVGAWEARDAQRRGIPHLAIVPCLFLTLMLGPLGLVTYLALRGVLRRTFSLRETTEAADDAGVGTNVAAARPSGAA